MIDKLPTFPLCIHYPAFMRRIFLRAFQCFGISTASITSSFTAPKLKYSAGILQLVFL